MNLFDVFDLLSIDFKYLILKKIIKFQIIDILNMLQTKDIITDDCIDTLLDKIAKWELETNDINYSWINNFNA